MSETEESQTEYYLNPATQRYIKVGSSTHKRLIKKLNCVKPIPQRVAPGNIKVQEVNPNDVLRHRLMEESTQMVKENLDSLGDVENMSQKQLDKMLKKLLISKLGLGEKTKKSKKKKKARFKVVAPPSSSESESDTESD
jgi:hypothetical protein